MKRKGLNLRELVFSCEDLYAKDASKLDDAAKVRLLIRKLGSSEYNRYAKFYFAKTCSRLHVRRNRKETHSSFW